MEYRELGGSGIRVSALGLGTAGWAGIPVWQGREVLAAALSAGFTYLEVPPETREVVGKCLRHWRDRLFLVSRLRAATAPELRAELDLALHQLRTEWLDAAVLELRDAAYLTRILEAGGALAALEEAVAGERIRLLGVACHHDPVLIRRALLSYPFVLAQFPVSPLEECLGPFLPLLEGALRWRRAGAVAVKPLGQGRLAGYASQCLRWALSAPVSCVVVGTRDAGEVVDAARALSGGSLCPAEREALAAVAERLAEVAVPWWRLPGHPSQWPEP